MDVTQCHKPSHYKSQILFKSDAFFCNNILLHIDKYYLLDFTIPFFPLPHFVYGEVLDINIVVVYLLIT